MHKLDGYKILLLWLVAAGSACAGPPLTTDDPGILDPRQLELIFFTTATATDVGDYYQVPALDVSMGVIKDHLQVSLFYPYARTDPADGDSETDFGNLELGLKWRFLRNDRFEMAVAPYYTFGVRPGTARKGIGDAADAAVLPLNVHY